MPGTPDTARVEIPTRTLVHALVHGDGSVDTGELYTVAGALGMSDQQVRLCVKRLVAEGRFTHEGRGRKAVLRATEDARRTLEPNVEFVRHAFRQDRGEAPWDGAWRLVAFAIPESARSARDALRDTIVWLGGAALHGGLYACANDWTELISAEAHRLGVSAAVTQLTSRDLRIGAIDQPRALAAKLWPLDEIAGRYARLLEVVRPRLTRLESGTDFTDVELLTIGVELGVEFSRAIEPDPLLPPELLPTPWPGRQARALLTRTWSTLSKQDRTNTTNRLYRLYENLSHP
ncbi:transcriptional regulator [Embleya scabrispora]|uniref:Transcriptional regulator n=1 Tax=Embleya scabrispora TaxID=159449 RepID=A0A1T3NSY2_9ACTN|nr:PaaX family transcriptional regulator C-terminal domain-containing protein [Embleya scabrispora]OPC79884.1 transcriptional regulator [Embleya scabrispora]